MVQFYGNCFLYSQVDIVVSCGGPCELHGIVFAELIPVLCDSCSST